MMSEFSSSLANIHNRMVAGQFSAKDSLARANVPRQALDGNDFKLINQMLSLVRAQQSAQARPSVGAQQMVASKKDEECKKMEKVLKELVDRKMPKPHASIEKSYKPKTQ